MTNKQEIIKQAPLLVAWGIMNGLIRLYTPGEANLRLRLAVAREKRKVVAK